METLSNNKTMQTEEKIKIQKAVVAHLAGANGTKQAFYKACGISEFTVLKMVKDDIDPEVGDNAWRSIAHFIKTGERYDGFPLEQKRYIQQQIKEYLKSRPDISQNKLATMVGVSGAVISHAHSDTNFSKEKLISNQMWRKIESYFDVRNTDHWALFKTNNYKQIMSLCEDAQQYGRFLACIGDTGLGKTATFKEYAKDHQNSYYVLCESVMTQKEFLWAIMKGLGITITGSCSLILNGITDRLLQLDKPLLILDDAGKLSDSNLAMIQLLYDKTDGNTRKAGIIIGGMPHLKLSIEKGIQLGKRGFAELHRRVGYWLGLTLPTRLMIQQICNHHGIKDKDVVTYIYKIATNYGTLKELITNVRRISQNGVTLEDLEEINVGDQDCFV